MTAPKPWTEEDLRLVTDAISENLDERFSLGPSDAAEAVLDLLQERGLLREQAGKE